MEKHTSNSKLQDIVHFLLLNSEAQEDIGFGGRIPLLYFFFAYAHNNSKQCYADFAFELLQEALSRLIGKTRSSNSAVMETVETGWALMRFVKMGFFESDGLEDILKGFDNVAILEVQRLSRGALHTKNTEVLLLCALYFLDRNDFTNEDEQCLFIIQEHLLISFFEIALRIKERDKKDVGSKLLLWFLLKNSVEHDVVGHFAGQALQELDMATWFTEQNGKGLEFDVIRYLYHQENDNCTVNRHEKLTGLLTGEIEKYVQQIYQPESEDRLGMMQKIIVFACILLSPAKRMATMFLAYNVNKFLPSREI